MKNSKAIVEGVKQLPKQTQRYPIGQNTAAEVTRITVDDKNVDRFVPGQDPPRLDLGSNRESWIAHRFDPIKPLNEGEGFRDPSDRPPKQGLHERPKSHSEDGALSAMWAELDRQTGLLNNQLQSVKIPPEQRWKKSLAETEARAQSLARPNATRDKIALQAQAVMQSEIWQSQHPADCKSAKYLFIANDKAQYGFGAQLHHFVYALIVGYASNRVVVIEKHGFKYAANMKAWCEGDTSIECFFERLGPCTGEITDQDGLSAPLWIPGDEDTEDRILRLRFRSSVEYRAWMPKRLVPILQQFHERPHLWWVGQFTSYMMRPSAKLRIGYAEFKSNLKGLVHPFMGMHVRGKEKASEAPVHPLHQYMPYVKYNPIYLATDDQDPYKESLTMKNYTWIYGVDKSSGRLSGVGDRHAENAILNLLYDMYLLSESDYFIGTDSSQISRAVYELMQTMNIDGTRLGVSLDTIFVDHELWFYWFII